MLHHGNVCDQRGDGLGGGLDLRHGNHLARGSATEGVKATEEGSLLLAELLEGERVDVVGEHGKAAAAQGRVDHEAGQRLADEHVALACGFGLDEVRDLGGELGIQGLDDAVVISRHEDRDQRGRGVDAIDDKGLLLHLARGALGKLPKGEGHGDALLGGTKGRCDTALERLEHVHVSPHFQDSLRGAHEGCMRCIQAHYRVPQCPCLPTMGLPICRHSPCALPSAESRRARRSRRPDR